MEDRLGRIEAVKMIISTQELSTQDELMAELKKAGYVVAQPTLSRDLKLLKVVKVMNDEGRYVYRMPDTQSFVSVSDTHLTLAAMNRMGALHVKFSGSVAVMKTLPGHAAHVAYDTCLATVMDVTSSDDMRTYCLLVPAFIQGLTYSIPLGLSSILYKCHAPLVVAALLIILAKGYSAAL